jgi:methylthioribose-1-phosphate isomerase
MSSFRVLYFMTVKYDTIRPIRFVDRKLYLIDQRILPAQNIEIIYTSSSDVADAITDMVVRGAPAIGVTAAYAVVLAAIQRYKEDPRGWKQLILKDIKYLSASRPTAVNLFWALNKMQSQIESIDGDPYLILKEVADDIHKKDIEANYAMGKIGADLITEKNCAVLTHCNAGALATGGYGTALGVIRSAYSDKKIIQVYADETRPWLQGARLTAWEMVQDDIPVTLISEGAAASLMQQGKISWVIVGSDRIAANGDVANKIGTYGLAVLAKYHGVKFMVAAPTTTIDMDISYGKNIPIEQRSKQEVLSCGSQQIAAEGADAWNPAFDVTPAELVDYIVTEKGYVEKPTTGKIIKLMQS